MVVSPDGRVLATVDRSCLHLVDLQLGRVSFKLPLERAPGGLATTSSTVLVGQHKKIAVYNALAGRAMSSARLGEEVVVVAAGQSGDRFAAGGRTGLVRLFRTASRRAESSWQAPAPVAGLAFDDSGGRLFCEAGQVLHELSVPGLMPIGNRPLEASPHAGETLLARLVAQGGQVVRHPDAVHLLVADPAGSVTLWTLDPLKPTTSGRSTTS